MMPYSQSAAGPACLRGWLGLEDQPVDASSINRFLQHCGAPVQR